MEKTSISIIVPALNEEKNIELAIKNCLNALSDLGLKGEVLCVNDGSTDNTLKIMGEMKTKDSRVRIINHAKPAGFGGAFWAGVSEARMELVTLLPGDNENDPWETLRYAGVLNQVDIVIPFILNPEVRSIYRRIISKIFNLVINYSFRINLEYTNGTILYRTSILRKLNSQNHSFFFQTDILIRLIRAGYIYGQVPQYLNLRQGGVSKAVTLSSFWSVLAGYFNLLKNQNEIVGKEYAKNSVTMSRLKNAGSKFKT